MEKKLIFVLGILLIILTGGCLNRISSARKALTNLRQLRAEVESLPEAEQKLLKRCLLYKIGEDSVQDLLIKVKSDDTFIKNNFDKILYCLNLIDDEIQADLYQGEIIKPAVRDPEKWGTAVCNDGTPFAFKIEKPVNEISNTWILYLQGGGFCDDNALMCEERKQQEIQLTTTLSGSDGKKFDIIGNEGIFNHDPKINPIFYNSNKVYAHYCSSDLWSGSSSDIIKTTGGKWYFSGRINVRSMLEILKEEYGLDDNNPETRILFTGGSAGCMGSNVNADQVRDLFPKTANDNRLKIVSDGCYAPNFDSTEYRLGNSGESLETVLQKAYYLWESEINPVCEKKMQKANQPEGSCFMGSEVQHYLTSCDEGLCLLNLIQYSSIDHWAVTNHGIDPNPSESNIALEEWRNQVLSEFNNKEITWLFSGGDFSYHTLLMVNDMWYYGTTNGVSFGELLYSFWNYDTPKRQIFGNPE